MIDRRQNTEADQLMSWERWPLAALFLANALNVFILYVPQDEMPPVVQSLLPWVRVACGVAAAASLEGTLIAVTMGRRLGRNSVWSWATMFAASVFTAAVAWYIHAGVGAAAALLFVGQAVVLFIYTQHLAQPRKPLQPPAGAAPELNRGEYHVAEIPPPALPDGKPAKLIRCKHCGEQVTLAMSGQHGRRHAMTGRCVAD